MSRRDKGLTESIFLVGLVMLLSDSYLWKAGLPALVIASALAYGIAWELPQLLFRKRVGASDQLAASLALTFVLLCFYLGKSDKAIAWTIEQQGQSAAFNSPLWLINDGVLLALTVAVMMVLLAVTTLVLHITQGNKDGKDGLRERLWQVVTRDAVCLLIGTIAGLGGGAWAVIVAENGLGFGIASWVAAWVVARSWIATRLSPLLRFSVAVGAALVLSGMVGGVVGAAPTGFVGSSPPHRTVTAALIGMTVAAALIGMTVALAHFSVLSLLKSLLRRGEGEASPHLEDRALELEPVQPRPKDAPFYVPWVGFYTMRFAGLLVAFFVVGAGWLWGLR